MRYESLQRHDQWQVVDDVLDPVRSTEKCLESALRIDDKDNRRMINRVISAFRRRLGEVDAEGFGQFDDFFEVAGDAEIALAEECYVFAHEFGCVPLGIDADKYDARQRVPASLSQLLPSLRKYLQRCRANVRAVREAEEHQVPLSFEDGAVDHSAVVIQQRESRKRVARGQHRGRNRDGLLPDQAERERQARSNDGPEYKSDYYVSKSHE